MGAVSLSLVDFPPGNEQDGAVNISRTCFLHDYHDTRDWASVITLTERYRSRRVPRLSPNNGRYRWRESYHY